MQPAQSRQHLTAARLQRPAAARPPAPRPQLSSQRIEGCVHACAPELPHRRRRHSVRRKLWLRGLHRASRQARECCKHCQCAPCSGTAFAAAACCFTQRGVRQAWRRCANERATRGGACAARGACAGWHLLTHLGLLVHSDSHAFLCGAHYRVARVSSGRARSLCARRRAVRVATRTRSREAAADESSKPANGNCSRQRRSDPRGPPVDAPLVSRRRAADSRGTSGEGGGGIGHGIR